MPTFRYTPLSGPGASPGVIDAPDRSAAVNTLLARGITPASVEAVVHDRPANAKAPKADKDKGNGTKEPPPTAAETAATASAIRPRRVMTLPELASFIRELATALQAGLPIVPALRTLAKSGRSAGQKAMLAHLIAEVEQGKMLADATRSWGKPFNELTISLMKAGESSGRLDTVLHQAADLLEKDVALRRSVMSATLYPGILCVLIIGAVTLITTVIVPRVLATVGSQLKTLPLPTRIIQGFATFITNWWWLLAFLIGLAVIGFMRARAQPLWRLRIDAAVLRIPLFGAVVRDALVARFTRTLGTLVASGLPVLSALRLTAATLTNAAMRTAVEHVCEQVAAGKTIAEPLEKAGVFPPLLVQIVSLGERSGKLPELLRQAAGSLDDRTQSRVKVITTILPPMLVVVAACFAGLIGAAIFLPLLEMQDAIGK